jgi:hypothetical protein
MSDVADFLVPKLCLGTQAGKLLLPERFLGGAKQSFAACVPKQSLGTRGIGHRLWVNVRGAPVSDVIDFG